MLKINSNKLKKSNITVPSVGDEGNDEMSWVTPSGDSLRGQDCGIGEKRFSDEASSPRMLTVSRELQSDEDGVKGLRGSDDERVFVTKEDVSVKPVRNHK